MSALSDMVARGLQTIMGLDAQSFLLNGVTVSGSYTPMLGADFPAMSGQQPGYHVTIPIGSVASIKQGDPVKIAGAHLIVKTVQADSVAWELTVL